MVQEATNAQVARRAVELLNRQELNALDELFVADVVTHTGSFSWELQDRAELKAFVMDLYDAFPDLWWTVDDTLAEGEMVIVRGTVEGTHEGRFAKFDVAATGETFEVRGVQMYRFEENWIVEGWLLFDVLGLIRQLGAPPPG